MTDNDNDKWLRVSEAAVVLGVSERTIWRRVKAGELDIDRSVTPHLVDVSDKVSDKVSDRAPTESDTVSEVAELRAEVERLEAVLSEVRDALQDARRERDDWKAAHAQSLRTSQRLLEHVEEAEPVEEPEEPVGVLQRVGRWLQGLSG